MVRITELFVNKPWLSKKMLNNDVFRSFKYILYPVIISEKQNIAIRKRLFHKGYFLLKRRKSPDGDIFEELAEKSTLSEVEMCMYDMFGIEIKL